MVAKDWAAARRYDAVDISSLCSALYAAVASVHDLVWKEFFKLSAASGATFATRSALVYGSGLRPSRDPILAALENSALSAVDSSAVVAAFRAASPMMLIGLNSLLRPDLSNLFSLLQHPEVWSGPPLRGLDQTSASAFISLFQSHWRWIR